MNIVKSENQYPCISTWREEVVIDTALPFGWYHVQDFSTLEH